MKTFLNSEGFTKFLAGLIVVAVLVAIFLLSWAIRAHAPCSVFPLAEAPTRCLPGAVR